MVEALNNEDEKYNVAIDEIIKCIDKLFHRSPIKNKAILEAASRFFKASLFCLNEVLSVDGEVKRFPESLLLHGLAGEAVEFWIKDYLMLNDRLSLIDPAKRKDNYIEQINLLIDDLDNEIYISSISNLVPIYYASIDQAQKNYEHDHSPIPINGWGGLRSV